ncbi:MAG: 7-cyano-7-deazaguanine synthase [Anaerolineales bacterium]|nr:7-cyano-7-deazaguanine synthase [Anaerolineales bacterium]
MNTFDYQFIFNDIIDGYSKVCLIKALQSESISFDIFIDDSHIHLLTGNHLSSIQADLLDLAIAIHFADKLAIPKKNRSIQIQLSLPLRHPDIFMQNEALLHDLLSWYTKDDWYFQFQSRKSKKRKSECCMNQLALPYTLESVEFALWSGGLDSLAGLQTRLLNNKSENFALIGTGSNNIMRKTQQQAFQALRYLPHASGHLRFLHVPINANYGARYSHNQSHRARGIVFLLIGAVCALSAGSRKLHVYETGIGAINLPLPGGVGRDHSKAVHPISLIKMEQFISSVNKELFLIENPFVFSTKAEMCISLKEFPQIIFETISCDRLHREKYIQCGFCSSCILRRQALLAAGIKDQTKYLIPHGKKTQERHLSYWKLMNRQIAILNDALNSLDPLFRLKTSYSNDFPDIVSYMAIRNDRNDNEIEQEIVKLYRTYVQEWQNSAIFIQDDMTNDRNHEQYLEDKRWHQMQLIN